MPCMVFFYQIDNSFLHFKHKTYTQWHSWMSYFVFVQSKDIDKRLSINFVMSEIILRCYQSLKRASHKLYIFILINFCE